MSGWGLGSQKGDSSSEALERSSPLPKPDPPSLSCRLLPISQGGGHAGGVQGLAGAFWGLDTAQPLPSAPAREVL